MAEPPPPKQCTTILHYAELFSRRCSFMNKNLEEHLRRHVNMLAGEIGERNVYRPAALDAAAHYIESEFARSGYTPLRQTYIVEAMACANLEIILPGQRWPNETLVLGAHYDSVAGSPGADDNASAVAALIEIARLIKGQVTARTLKLVAFVNEEPPFFFFGEMGSKVYAHAARSRQENIRLMI
jgi:hypothetical protein